MIHIDRSKTANSLLNDTSESGKLPFKAKEVLFQPLTVKIVKNEELKRREIIAGLPRLKSVIKIKENEGKIRETIEKADQELNKN